jgi:hypothetical protein
MYKNTQDYTQITKYANVDNVVLTKANDNNILTKLQTKTKLIFEKIVSIFGA